MDRKIVSYWRCSLVAVAMAAAAGGAQAGSNTGARPERPDAPVMPIAGAALPPGGFLALCARSPGDCVEDVDSIPDLATLELAANRRYWSDVFQPRSAPAALSRSDAYDWSAVFAPAAAERVVTSSVRPDDGLVITIAHGLIASSPVTLQVSAQWLASGNGRPAGAGSDASGADSETPVLSDLDPDAGGTAGVFALADGASGLLATVAVVDSDAGAASAADAGTPAIEVAAEAASDFAASATDLPIPGTVGIPDGSSMVADIAVLAGMATDAASSQPAVFTLDRDGRRLVNAINRRLNREIRQVSDRQLYGMEDFWNRPEGSRPQGDCEDYVLAKRAALIEQGVPAAALSIAIVETRWGESHAVLLLASDRGEFILDSLSPWVVRWDRADYAWRERQLPGRPFDWVRVAV